MSDKDGENLLLKFLLLLMAWPLVTIFGGFVLSRLWLWFAVVPFGFRPLPIVECIGISLIVKFVTNDVSIERKNLGIWETLGVSIVGPLFVWGYGWIVHLFL